MIRGPFPLHTSQLDIYIDQSLKPKSPHYNIGGYTTFTGNLDIQLFEKIVNSLPIIFDAVRIRIDLKSNDPCCYFDEDFNAFPLQTKDFSDLIDPLSFAKDWMQGIFNQPFVFSKENPLCEHYIIKINKSSFLYFYKYHHIAIDGWALSITNHHIANKYKSLKEGKDYLVTYSLYENEMLRSNDYYNGPDYSKEGEFWKKEIPLWPSNIFNNKKIYPESKKTGRIAFEFSGDEKAAIDRLVSSTACNLQNLTLAVLVLYFGRTSSNTEFVFGVSLHKRLRLQRDIVGTFTGTTPFISSYDPDSSLKSLIKYISLYQRASYRNQNYLLGDIKRDHKISSSGDHIFEVIVNYALLDLNLNFGEDIDARTYGILSEQEVIPLRLMWEDYGEQQSLRLLVDFSLEYFTEQEVRLLTERFLFILSQFEIGLDKQLCEFDIIPQEQIDLLVAFNDTAADYPRDKTIVDLFLETVSLYPDHTALVFGEVSMSYRELDSRSNQVGHYLRSRGVREENFVALCIDRGLDMIVGMLGILKSGGAYVPLDPSYPQERLDYMLSDTSSNVVLCGSSTFDLFGTDCGAEVVVIDRDWSVI